LGKAQARLTCCSYWESNLLNTYRVFTIGCRNYFSDGSYFMSSTSFKIQTEDSPFKAIGRIAGAAADGTVRYAAAAVVPALALAGTMGIFGEIAALSPPLANLSWIPSFSTALGYGFAVPAAAGCLLSGASQFLAERLQASSASSNNGVKKSWARTAIEQCGDVLVCATSATLEASKQAILGASIGYVAGATSGLMYGILNSAPFYVTQAYAAGGMIALTAVGAFVGAVRGSLQGAHKFCALNHN
jgi:hypothetical protein